MVEADHETWTLLLDWLSPGAKWTLEYQHSDFHLSLRIIIYSVSVFSTYLQIFLYLQIIRDTMMMNPGQGLPGPHHGPMPGQVPGPPGGPPGPPNQHQGSIFCTILKLSNYGSKYRIYIGSHSYGGKKMAETPSKFVLFFSIIFCS